VASKTPTAAQNEKQRTYYFYGGRRQALENSGDCFSTITSSEKSSKWLILLLPKVTFKGRVIRGKSQATKNPLRPANATPGEKNRDRLGNPVHPPPLHRPTVNPAMNITRNPRRSFWLAASLAANATLAGKLHESCTSTNHFRQLPKTYLKISGMLGLPNADTANTPVVNDVNRRPNLPRMYPSFKFRQSLLCSDLLERVAHSNIPKPALARPGLNRV